jgi:hypothetical protein
MTVSLTTDSHKFKKKSYPTRAYFIPFLSTFIKAVEWTKKIYAQ